MFGSEWPRGPLPPASSGGWTSPSWTRSRTDSHGVRHPSNSSYVVVAGDSGEPGCEHGAPPGVGLALEHDGVTGSFESEVDPSDAAEQRPDIHTAPRRNGASSNGSAGAFTPK
jgi:hypothetical protein